MQRESHRVLQMYSEEKKSHWSNEFQTGTTGKERCLHRKKEENGGKQSSSSENNTYGEALMLGKTHSANVRNDKGVSL